MDASKVYAVGPDRLHEFDLDRIQADRLWVVYWYSDGGYDGNGIGAALRPDGKIEWSGLDHCSCYGPMEDWGKNEISVAEFLTYDRMDHAVPLKERSPEDYDFGKWQLIVSKVRELVA